jgi:antitoxin StbD
MDRRTGQSVSGLAHLRQSIEDILTTPVSSRRMRPVAVHNHNRVMDYMVPADVFEAMMERLDDLDLTELVRACRHETPVPLELDDL